jgi:hypothetical protein
LCFLACAVLFIRRQTHDSSADRQEGRLKPLYFVCTPSPPTPIPTLDGDDCDDAAVAQSVACGLVWTAHELGLCSFRTLICTVTGGLEPTFTLVQGSIDHPRSAQSVAHIESLLVRTGYAFNHAAPQCLSKHLLCWISQFPGVPSLASTATVS